MKTYCKAFQHTYKPALRKGPTYVLGLYAGHDWLGTDQLACAKCGKRRLPFITAVGNAAGALLLGALGVAIISVIFSLVLLLLRIALEVWS